MLKKSTLVLLSSLFFFGCDKPIEHISKQQLRSELMQLNHLLLIDNSDVQGKAQYLPFSEAYLKKRHDLLSKKSDLSNSELSELNYLQIQQRYPERYLPWPSNIDVVQQLAVLNDVDLASQWFSLVKRKLENGQESKIRLNRIEKSRLQTYLSNAIFDEVDSKQALIQYLKTYRVRSDLGLFQLPNGKEWYQSKLNFYGNIDIPPYQLLANVVDAIDSEDKPSHQIDFAKIFVDEQALLIALLGHQCVAKPGLNWRDNFVHIPDTVAFCKQQLRGLEKLVYTVMELDIGLHYQGWTMQQAVVALNSRLALNEQQAQQVIENTLDYPATIFAAYPHLNVP
ncbi:hypothetical protein ACSLBF_11515 [Pseudoalteromonas sp. T1lg65]|uniref:hypothetical protein n=1 Tax=Pseudoalteromonas sp. T1lg65 TaxID=2077101 RepID=UPI003F7AFA3D